MLKASARAVLTVGAGAAGLSFQIKDANAASIAAVRIWPARDYTRVTLEMDRPLNFKQFLVTGPDRLVVDLEGVDVDAPLRQLVAKVQPNDPYIEQVRVGQFQPSVVRLVFDLKGAVRPQIFQLQPVAAYKHRLVLDLYPVVAQDPLAQLIEQHPGKSNDDDQKRLRDDPIDQIVRADEARERVQLHGEKPIDSRAESRALPGATKPPAQQAAAPAVAQSLPPAAKSEVRVETVVSTKARVHGRPSVERLLTIAIDPGHGGEDPGATGHHGTHEKHVVLLVAQRLRERIDNDPMMRSYLTRDGDYFVPLGDRVRKARRVKADLFVSIHADAFVTPHARGASVFALSEGGATSTAARWLASRENNADLVGGVRLSSRDREVARLLLDLSTAAQIKDSLQVGRSVLSELGSIGQLHRASVEQASFAVLKAPDIPSILVETAYISNPQEEERLGDRRYQNRLAEAIYRGIQHYFKQHPPAAKGGAV